MKGDWQANYDDYETGDVGYDDEEDDCTIWSSLPNMAGSYKYE